MKSKAGKTVTSAAGQARRRFTPDSSASQPAPLDAKLREKAVAEFLVKGAEEIQSHLALAAQVKAKMARLLAATIEELERVRRLETLMASIAGTGPVEAQSEPGFSPGSGKTARTPGSYFAQEIKTLKKAQKILGIQTLPGLNTVPSPSVRPQAFSPVGETAEPAPAKSVLIVINDPGTVRLLKYFLEKENCRVLACSNGPAGLRTAARERPDLILLDIMIPGMDGLQFLKKLKKNEETAPIPVFVLSVLAQEADILKAIEGGAADYFIKPFSPPVLIAKVKRALEARRG